MFLRVRHGRREGIIGIGFGFVIAIRSVLGKAIQMRCDVM